MILDRILRWRSNKRVMTTIPLELVFDCLSKHPMRDVLGGMENILPAGDEEVDLSSCIRVLYIL